MKTRLTRAQAAEAVRTFIADPGDDSIISMRIPVEAPIRLTCARDGSINVFTHEDAEPPKKRVEKSTNTD